MTHIDDAAARTLAAYESGAARWAEVTPWRRSPLQRKLDAPRRFTYWLEDDLGEVVTAAGWTLVRVAESTQPSSLERWIDAIARNDVAG